MELKNMKNKFLTLLASSMLVFTFSFADNCCPSDPCCPDTDWCGGWSVGAEFLWWTSCVNDLDYAALNDHDSTTTGVLKYKYVDHDWSPGFRVNAIKSGVFCGWDLMVSYTYWRDSSKGKTEAASGERVFSTWFHGGYNFEQGKVTAKHKLKYQTVDVLLAYDCMICDCHHLKPFWGFQWVNIDQSADSHLYGSGQESTHSGSFGWDSDFNAYGLKIGTEYSFAFCENFELYTMASGTIAVADLDSHSHHVRTVSSSNTADLKFKNDECVFAPGYHLGVGLRYETCYCDWDIKANIGYEFIEWRNVPNIRRFTDDVNDLAIATSATGSTIGFHGLVAGLSFSF